MRWERNVLYEWGQRIHRAFTKTHRLARKVISVGNISVGGRGKTPFVIEICRGLRDRGIPVAVLTRGYGRTSRLPVILSPGRGADVHTCGDEALEVFVRGGASVLVGSRRALNAKALLAAGAPDNLVFVLDDGFQHWALERDFDLVLIDESDLQDRVLPRGRLREPSSALRRAHLVLCRGKDFAKQAVIPAPPEAGAHVTALTTRAPDPQYVAELRAQFPALEVLALSDHASVFETRRALARAGAGALLLGAKEAAKLFSFADYQRFIGEGELPLTVNGRNFHAHYVRCDLALRSPQALWDAILNAVRA